MRKLSEKVKITGTGIRGLTAKLIKREGKVCMYERSDGLFEVFIVKEAPAENKFGKEYPEREVYPSNEDFGSIAWCISSLERAAKRYRMLLEPIRNADEYESGE